MPWCMLASFAKLYGTCYALTDRTTTAESRMLKLTNYTGDQNKQAVDHATDRHLYRQYHEKNVAIDISRLSWNLVIILEHH